MSPTEAKIFGGATAGFLALELLAAGVGAAVVFIPYIPFIGFLIASRLLANPNAFLALCVCSGAVLGMGMWLIMSGFFIAGLIDLGVGLYWALQISRR